MFHKNVCSLFFGDESRLQVTVITDVYYLQYLLSNENKYSSVR